MIIKNDGEMDINALLLLGASSKRDDDTKIGYFGSGSKYALAVLLREGIDVKIYSGEKEILIGLKETEFRGTTFQKITIDGNETGLTTSLGADWKLWQAIREIYCNAVDEGGHKVESLSSDAGPEKGYTVFVLEPNTPDALVKMNEIQNNWDAYFTESRTDLVVSSKDIKIFEPIRDTLSFYRKGIRVYDTSKKSLYDYDLDQIAINESRIVKYSFDMNEKVAVYLGELANEEMINKIFKEHLNNDYFEYSLNWRYCKVFNNNWLKVINGRKLIRKSVSGHFIAEQQAGGLVLEDILITSLEKFFGDKIKIAGKTHPEEEFTEIAITPRNELMIGQAFKFYESAGVKVDHPIKVGIFEDSRIRGLVGRDGATVYLSTKVFEDGMRMLSVVLLEEAMHIETGFPDKSREFQTYLINKIVNSLEEKAGVIV